MRFPPWLKRNVLILGFVSLLTDVASEMTMSLMPLFLATTLGGGAIAIGAVEGIANAVAAVLKLEAGRLSDRLGRTKPLVFAGYTLSALARPLMAVVASPVHVLLVRVADRMGKGLRTSPRDALLASEVPEGERGRVYGFHRAMDHTGAVLGPALALALLHGGVTDVRTIFALTVIPGLLAVLAFGVGVRETTPHAPTPARSRLVPMPGVDGLLLPVGLSALTRGVDALLLLRVGSAAEDPTAFPILWMLLHVVKASTSGLGGSVSDRLGPRTALLLGWATSVAAFAWLAVVQDPVLLLFGFLLHGFFDGLSEGPEKALIVSMVPEARRGEALGRYHLVVGIAGIGAGLTIGALWDTWGPAVGLGWAASVAAVAWCVLAGWVLLKAGPPSTGAGTTATTPATEGTP